MPETTVKFYREKNGKVVVLEWLKELKSTNKRAYAKCREKIERLERSGYDLRMPHAKPLRDGIHELRVREDNVNYRILFCFIGQNVALLSHGLTKEAEVPPREIDKAIRHKQNAMHDPASHIEPEI